MAKRNRTSVEEAHNHLSADASKDVSLRTLDAAVALIDGAGQDSRRAGA